MFPCETILESSGKACGHPLNIHDPCTGTVGTGKRARPCDCQAFTPADVKERVASLTDPANRASAIAAIAKGGRA